MQSKTLTLAGLALIGGLTLTACGGNGDSMAGMQDSATAPSSSTPDSGQSSNFNNADVTFATDMIPHHRQAVMMAQLADTRAQRPEVKNLAAQIMKAQDPEIQTMSDWLRAWGKPVPQDMGGMDMSGSMPGMMSTGDMDSLKSASGAAFDKMFLTMMIQHHQGAVEMARTEMTDGRNADAKALAKRIEQSQAKEIKTMQGLLS